ncbi:MAG: Uma2 family endonuclease [Bacteroidota bacterium]
MFFRSKKKKATISAENPVRLDKNNEPAPDVSILKFRTDDYSEHHPIPEDVLILIEVTGTTYDYDKTRKSFLYAKYLIPEYWIIDIKRKRIEVYSDIDEEEYLQKKVVGIKDEVDLLNNKLLMSNIFC